MRHFFDKRIWLGHVVDNNQLLAELASTLVFSSVVVGSIPASGMDV